MYRSLLTMMLAGGVSTLAAQTPSPYAGQERGTIKALSDDQIQGLREGRGVGFAMAAELNHYPGPRHVLDLGDSLRLSAGQRADLQAIYDTMHAAVLPLGASLIAVEARMDSLFADRRMDEPSLERLTAESARLGGLLRLAHLRAHLATLRDLTPAQVAAYDRFRGYGDESAGHHHHAHG